MTGAENGTQVVSLEGWQWNELRVILWDMNEVR